MANAVVKVPKAGTWIELTAAGVPAGYFAFSNTGSLSILVQYAAATPEGGNLAKKGDLYKPHEGDRPSLAGTTLRAWARLEVGSEGTVDGEVFVTLP